MLNLKEYELEELKNIKDLLESGAYIVEYGKALDVLEKIIKYLNEQKINT